MTLKKRLLPLLLVAMMVCCAFITPAIAAPHDPPIDVTFVRSTDDALENNVLSKLPGETLEDNRWTKLAQEQYGINIKYLWIAKGTDQYTQKFNTAIASGEIPDVMLVDNVQLKSLYEADLIQELGPVFDEYANALHKKIVEDAGESARIPATFDGKLYGIPLCNSDLEATQLLWMRKDWLENYGLEAPTTIDELVNVLTVFNKNVEGGDGVGLVVQKDLWGVPGLEGFFNAYGAYPNRFWIEKEGKLAYGPVQPEMKLALAKLNEMYTSGLLDKEFTVKDGGKAGEALVSGKSGAYYGAQWSPLFPLQDNVNQDPNADWIPVAIPTATDVPAKSQMTPGTTQWYVVSSECEHPEALMELFNLYIDKTFDPELQEYDVYSNVGGNVEGVWKLTPVYQFTAKKNLETHLAIADPLKSGDASSLFGEQLAMYNFSKSYLDGDKLMWGWNKIFGEGGSWSVINGYAQNDQVLLTKFLGVPGETMTDYQTTLEKGLNEAFVKIIVGQEPIEAFDAAVAAWAASGGDDITAEVNEWYDTTK